MGTPKEPNPVKFFAALLAADSEVLAAVEPELGAALGEIDGRSEIFPWNASRYYEKEMGTGLLRRFVSFLPLAAPDQIVRFKLAAQGIERHHLHPVKGGRRVNVDPGYADALKVVLASTKNAGQRIYLGSGIYAEATLLYHDGGFHGLPHTYPDYLWPETHAFLSRLRSGYLAQLSRRN